MQRFALAAALAVLLSGCVSTGTKVDTSKVAAFQPGVTTMQDAERALGPPNQVTREADGSTVLVYAYAKMSPNGATFVPVVGLFAGKSTVDSTTATLVFDKDGKFVRSSTSEGHTVGGVTGG
ncbi:MAG TPA: hypothetical protein VF178_08770 [Gemmatimonadaceae bacterium]